MKRLLYILALLICTTVAPISASAGSVSADTSDAADADREAVAQEENHIDAKEIIFEHLGDRYGWEVPFCHDKSIPLPVIVITDNGFHMFSSARVDHGKVYKDGDATFRIASDGEYRGKVVEVMADGSVVRPIDISITKNVFAIFIACIIVAWCVFGVKNWYKKNPLKAPRKTLGALEAIILFMYDSVVKSTLRDRAPKFAPYLLTVFLFIFFMNLLGLIVIFPGGANITGNIAVTLTLALVTFVFTNFFATKHYWKEIFWPDVPVWLKFPLPIMQIIEIFGMFTKPAALTVRLFANMMGGHMIVLVLTLLIFIFGAMGTGVAAGTAVVSILFSVFMLLIDVLVSFIQAYVFTMLSTVFIAQAQATDEHGHEDKKDAAHAVHPSAHVATATQTATAN